MNKAQKVTKINTVGANVTRGDVVSRDGLAVRIVDVQATKNGRTLITGDSARFPGLRSLFMYSADEAVTVLHGSADDLARWIER